MPDVSVAGRCDARFAAVRAAFEHNFHALDEVGAGLCIRIDGREVVDLWGGRCDERGGPAWRGDTLVNAYSVGKAVMATLVLRLVADGALALDDAVARHWPEFAAHGKERLTVRELLAHRAGLPAVREPLDEDAIFDSPRMAAALGTQRAFWEPGTAHGYHVNTFGYLVAELLRRVTGDGAGRLLRERLCGPLGGLDLHIGLPASEHGRVASICGVATTSSDELRKPETWQQIFGARESDEETLMVGHCYFNPMGLSGIGIVNTARWREAEMPSANAHATARAVAAVLDATLPHAGWLPATLVEDATRTHSDGTDRVLQRPSRFGAGYMLTQETRPFGPNEGAYGHYGYGGSLGFADPVAGVAFGYLINRPGDRWQNPRTEGLIEALYESLGA